MTDGAVHANAQFPLTLGRKDVRLMLEAAEKRISLFPVPHWLLAENARIGLCWTKTILPARFLSNKTVLSGGSTLDSLSRKENLCNTNRLNTPPGKAGILTQVSTLRCWFVVCSTRCLLAFDS